MNIIQQLTHNFEKHPNAIAYQTTDQSYTYQTLYQDIKAVAVDYQEKLNNKAPIVVYGGFEYETLVSMLAATFSGHAYIPVATDTPMDRIQNILQVAQPAAIVAIADWPLQNNEQTLISKLQINKLQIEKNLKNADRLQSVQDDETLYIIFTSGTTGLPKGVQISVNNLSSFTDWFVALGDFKAQSNFLLQAPFSFDLSVMSLYPALATGSCLKPLAPDVAIDFQRLFKTLPQLDLNIWVSTPSFMAICLLSPEFNADQLPSLQQFFFCGEELPVKTAQQLNERFPNAVIYNTYGPTEATVAMSAVALTKDLLKHATRLPIGYQKADTQVLFYDRDQKKWSKNAGEIAIKGPGVSKGYLHNSEKTQAAFVEVNGQTVYLTGDAGFIDQQGLLHYDGRIDFQVKWHGYRIELEDIDAHLNQVSLVQEAIVVPKYQKNSHQVQQLVAYIVAKENQYETKIKLIQAIKQELAKSVMHYMVPQRFVFVTHIPKTVNGKLDRKHLINEVNS